LSFGKNRDTHGIFSISTFYTIETIDEQEECATLITLTQAQYNSKPEAEKLAYRKSQERCGLNIGYDKIYAYCMDQGYREGWDIEYTNKTVNVNPDYVPIGKPSLILPVYPSPLPSEIQYEGNMSWYKTAYTTGWNNGCLEGTNEGRIEGKVAGKSARLKGDDYHFANVNGYRKGYNDALLNLTAMHDVRRNRRLRTGGSGAGGVERQMREEYENAYAEGYAEAMEAEEAAQHERELGSVERHLKASKSCSKACIKYHSDTTLNTDQWTTCKLIVRACRSMTRRTRSLQEGSSEDDPEFEWDHVDTLPMDGEQGGADFKRLLEHLVSSTCNINAVKYEIWKMCPIVGDAPTPAPTP
jgi:hypothetical protein